MAKDGDGMRAPAAFAGKLQTLSEAFRRKLGLPTLSDADRRKLGLPTLSDADLLRMAAPGRTEDEARAQVEALRRTAVAIQCFLVAPEEMHGLPEEDIRALHLARLASKEAEERAYAETRAKLYRAMRDDMGASPAAIAKALRQELAKSPVEVAIVPKEAESPKEKPKTIKGWIKWTEDHYRPRPKGSEPVTEYAEIVRCVAAAAGFDYTIDSIRVEIQRQKNTDGA
jgi:hypothetical protein